MSRRIRLATLAASSILYVASMFLPCFSLTIFGVEKWFPGVFGFLGGLADPLNPNKPPNAGVHFASWVANPVFWAGLYLLIAHKPKWSMFAGLTSCVLAVLAVCSLWDKIAGWPAFWTWLAGFATLAIGSECCARWPASILNVSDMPDGTVDERIQR